MCALRLFLLKSCIFGVCILVTEASVLLQTFDGNTSYFKGSSVELVCTIIPYNNEMTWYVDNKPYAGCFLGTCGPSPNKPYTFIFTFNESAREFKLTIDSVNLSHASLSFACDDGNVRETISINVTIGGLPGQLYEFVTALGMSETERRQIFTYLDFVSRRTKCV